MYNFKAGQVAGTEAVARMRDSLLRRGPDDNGIFLSPDKRLCLAHTRLSIIDLTALGHQPMSNSSGTVWLSYNGEIYNYRQLQKELKGAGHVFRSDSDTEVIIHGYTEWGIAGLLERLRGMFAFAIYDIREKEPRLILVRDRFGIKPLYYYQDSEQLIFSSEVRAILKGREAGFVSSGTADIAFLLFGHVPGELTTVKNIFSLPAATYMTVNGRQREIVKYYELIDSFAHPKIRDGEEAYRDFLAVLEETIDIYLISDAPLGVFLSGGIDSSALVALAAKKREAPITTLSIIFDEEEYSELPFQRMIAELYHTEHREIKVTEKDFFSEIDNIFAAMDQPTVDGINTYFVSRAASRAGLKTVLSGTGADEVFCGYETFKRVGALRAMCGMPRICKYPLVFSSFLNDRWGKLVYLKEYEGLGLYLALRGLFAPRDVAQILDVSEKEVYAVLDDFKLAAADARLKSLSAVDWLSCMEIKFYLRNQLLKDTDFMSMYHSLETRVPYLDHVLVDYAASVDAGLKLDKDIPKPLLVKSLGSMLPRAIVARKKKGFTFPFDLWLKNTGEGLFREAVSGKKINKKYADRLWREFAHSNLQWARIWGLVVMGRRYG